MPEGPEIKFMIFYLNKKFKKSTLFNIFFTSGRYTRHPKPKNYKSFINNLPSLILSFNSKGKYIFISLLNNWFISITLGMSGHLILDDLKHSHIKFSTSIGNFFINDIRNFATINFFNNFDLINKKIIKLGPDPLSNSLYCHKLFIKLKSIKNQNTIIANLLLDQNFISGIGNYIRAESLYRSNISPFRKIKNLNYKEFCILLQSIKYIMKKSYKTQLKNGLHSFNFKIYKQKLTPNGKNIYQNKTNGRTIWWSPENQI